MDLFPVILSGGSGTRLWPLSREHYPKQLLALYGTETMLQATAARLNGIKLPAGGGKGAAPALRSTIIVCNEEHRFLVAEQLRQAKSKLDRIILEPQGRNTAPAVTLAALSAVAQHGDGVMLVMPADHVIKDVAAFQAAVAAGFSAASNGSLVTFGIVPTAPETGYGYIKQGAEYKIEGHGGNVPAFILDSFVEKPERQIAEGYVRSGQYLWNSGIFMFKASVWLDALQAFRPDIADACRRSYDQGSEDKDFYRAALDAFAACPSDSIDYAVMERVTSGEGKGRFRAVVIPLDAGWSDVGAWSSLWEISDRDENGNVLRGDVYAHKTKNTLVYSESRLVAAVGVENLIIVETADAVMVTHRDNAQAIKDVVNRLKSEKRTQHQTHRRVFRPWGSFEGIDLGDRFQVKRITVNPGASLSLQMHHHRAEHWIVVRGTAMVQRDSEEYLISENQSTYIPLGIKHRLSNPGKVPLDLIEVQSGSYLGEDDIVRFEDVYGRGK